MFANELLNEISCKFVNLSLTFGLNIPTSSSNNRHVTD